MENSRFILLFSNFVFAFTVGFQGTESLSAGQEFLSYENSSIHFAAAVPDLAVIFSEDGDQAVIKISFPDGALNPSLAGTSAKAWLETSIEGEISEIPLNPSTVSLDPRSGNLVIFLEIGSENFDLIQRIYSLNFDAAFNLFVRFVDDSVFSFFVNLRCPTGMCGGIQVGNAGDQENPSFLIGSNEGEFSPSFGASGGCHLSHTRDFSLGSGLTFLLISFVFMLIGGTRMRKLKGHGLS